MVIKLFIGGPVEGPDGRRLSQRSLSGDLEDSGMSPGHEGGGASMSTRLRRSRMIGVEVAVLGMRRALRQWEQYRTVRQIRASKREIALRHLLSHLGRRIFTAWKSAVKLDTKLRLSPETD